MSGQFIGATSRQIQHRSICDSLCTIFHLSVLVLLDHLFSFVSLNLQLLLECSDISIKLIWVPIMYVVVMTYIWLGRLWIFFLYIIERLWFCMWLLLF